MANNVIVQRYYQLKDMTIDIISIHNIQLAYM